MATTPPPLWDASSAAITHRSIATGGMPLLLSWDVSFAAIPPLVLPLHTVLLPLLLWDATIAIVGCFHCYCYCCCYFKMPLLLSWDATIATIASLLLLLQSVLLLLLSWDATIAAYNPYHHFFYCSFDHTCPSSFTLCEDGLILIVPFL